MSCDPIAMSLLDLAAVITPIPPKWSPLTTTTTDPVGVMEPYGS